ncbi:mucin-5AC isoform X2 [Bradysia coprophila]|uniref:mucin-5AC isoform X2 n=1 Tax=Bradysia coprophila TaxID=38358 RepID=UPI00187DBC76|nr:mucin-5AC isoform X2 [Bradysia coprophila]
MSNYAWVTLATNDSYSLGALVVANSLKNVNTIHQTAVLITPGVSESMKSKLEASFNIVVEVNVLDSQDAANLALLSRPELGVTFTKLHCWRLTQFEKCVFLDADTFVLQNCDELFDREELSAAPDVGWPDCFNSGVFVFRPSLDTFGKLIEFATRQGSFDGGDQGLLNSFFSDWAHKDISKHLPFIYNTCSTACYSYLPAFKQFGQNVKILHFIGQVKPWLLNFDSSSKTVYPPQGYGHLGEYLQQWWNVFCADVHPALTTEMTTSLHQQYSHETQWCQNTIGPNLSPVPNPPHIEFSDPWDAYYQTNDDHTESSSHECFIAVHNIDNMECSHSEQNHESLPIPHNNCEDHQSSHTTNANVDLQHTLDAPHISIRSSFIDESNDIASNANFHQTCHQIGDTSSHSINENSFLTVTHDNTHASTLVASLNNGSEILDNGEHASESCQNESYDGDVEDVNEDETTVNCEEGGLAGALAQLTLGSPRSAQQVAYEESMRRQCWEAGNIDYLVTVGPTLSESEEDALATAPSNEKTITEVTEDGRIIEKKIVTYPGEETTEIEEIEEVDGQTVSVKRSIIGGENTAAAQPTPKTLAEIKSEPVVLVPGYKTVEIDEKTNSTIVTEKTTTGYQQTITTTQEDGTKKIQTKTFYDPVEIPGEEVEEETYEEIETFEPGSEKTTVTTTTETKDATESTVVPAEVGIVEEQPASDLLTQDETVKKDEKSQQEKTEESKALIDLKNQPIVIVPGHQKVEFDKETNTTTVTEKTTTGYQQTITTVTPDGRTIVQTKVFYDPIPSEQVEQAETTTTTTVTEVSDVPISKDNPETQQPTEVHEQCVETVKTTEAVKETEETTTTDGKDLQLALAAPAGQTSLTQKKTTAGGKEIEVTAVVSEDGKTKTLRKTTRQPSEEIEIEEYEETQSYEPGEVKVITTKKTVPLVEALEDAAKDIVDKSEKVVVTSTEKQVPEKSDSTIQTAVTEQVKSEEVQITTEAKPATTDPKQTTTTTESSTTVATQSTPIVKPTITADKQITAEEMETSTEAREVKTETKQTVIDANKIITEEKEAITESKQSTTEAKESISEAKQTVTDDTKITEAKQTTTEAKQTKTAAKEAITKAKETVTDAKKITEAKQSTTEAKQTTTEAKQAIIEAKQTVTDANKIKTEATETTTEAKETTTGAKQATSSVKKTITPASVPGKLGAVEPKQIKKVTKPEQTDSSVKKVSKPSDKDTKKTSPAVTVKTTTTTTTAVKKGEDTQKKTAADKTVTESTVIGEPKVTTKNGETTTEVVRRIPGGTEHTWTTVRADGSTKTESKKCFDVVELSSDEEYEEYEEIVEDDTIPLKTTTTKTQAPAAAASVKGPKTPTITDATPPSTPPLKPLVIGSTSSALKAEHEIPDTPPLDKVEQLRKKKLQSAPASKVAPKVDKPVVEAPKGATTKVAQKVDKPVVEAPKAPVTKVAQKVDKPVVEAPKAPVTKVAQKADKPVVEAPKAPATKVAQKVDKPVVEAPKAPVTKVAQKVDKPVVEAPKAPPRKKEVKTPAAEK